MGYRSQHKKHLSMNSKPESTLSGPSGKSQQFETYVEDGWKDGFGRPIKNWKNKAKNCLTAKKPWNYGKATKTTEQPAHLSWSNKP